MSVTPRSTGARFVHATTPEPGQLVEVRRRQWVVADVVSSNLEGAPQNCVTLSSIDEDGLGEELEVVWEIEPGAQVIERASLPSITGQDDATTLDAFLDAVRWGAATNADRGFLQAPFRSGVSIEDFQLDPLVRAIDMARVNLLIADDVTKLKRAWLDRVRTLSREAGFLDHPELPKLMATWKRWADGAEVRAWCDRVTTSDEGLLALLSKFLQHTKSQTMGDWAVRLRPRLDPRG